MYKKFKYDSFYINNIQAQKIYKRVKIYYFPIRGCIGRDLVGSRQIWFSNLQFSQRKVYKI